MGPKARSARDLRPSGPCEALGLRWGRVGRDIATHEPRSLSVGQSAPQDLP